MPRRCCGIEPQVCLWRRASASDYHRRRSSYLDVLAKHFPFYFLFWFENRSLFAVVTIQRFAAKNPPFWREHHPLPAIGIMRRLADGIVRHYVDHEIPGAVVDELMRFARF